MGGILAILEMYRLAAGGWRVLENMREVAVLGRARNGVAVERALKGWKWGYGFSPGDGGFFTPKLKNVAGRQNNIRLGVEVVILL